MFNGLDNKTVCLVNHKLLIISYCLLPKCIKMHVRACKISKFFRGSYPRTPAKLGATPPDPRGGDGAGGREGQGREGNKQVGGEGRLTNRRKGKWRGREEGRGGERKGRDKREEHVGSVPVLFYLRLEPCLSLSVQ